MKTIRFGMIGCGQMGREFASATARWCHLTQASARPVLTAICNRSLRPEKIGWFTGNFPSIDLVTEDYRELLASPEVDAVYVAVPHHLHQEIYCAAIRAGKHLLGEKPMGIDLAANEAILDCMGRHPNVLVRGASQYIFYPAVQRILKMIADDAFGRIIELDSGFLHSSDLDPDKPINWKRLVEYNGLYGVMGDLGVHSALVAFRAGWEVLRTTAICSNLVSLRPGAEGWMVPCSTWDNVTMLSRMRDLRADHVFPWVLRLDRIMPGEKNSWYLNIYGTKACARFSLKNPRRLELLFYRGDEQRWESVDMGFETAYPTITGSIFEFGASDAFMQMMAAFIEELAHGQPSRSCASCPTPEEVHGCHCLFNAALRSNESHIEVSSLKKSRPVEELAAR